MLVTHAFKERRGHAPNPATHSLEALWCPAQRLGAAKDDAANEQVTDGTLGISRRIFWGSIATHVAHLGLRE